MEQSIPLSSNEIKEQSMKDALMIQNEQNDKTDELNKSFLLNLFNTMVHKYKRNINTEWVPIKHTCFVTDRKITRRNDVYQLAPQGDEKNQTETRNAVSSCTMINIKADIYQTQGGNVHLCMDRVCPEYDTQKEDGIHTSTKTEVTQVFVCMATGKPHFCEEFCEAIYDPVYKNMIVNEDGTITCPLTGLCTGYQEWQGAMRVAPESRHLFEERRILYLDWKETTGQNADGRWRRGKKRERIEDTEIIIENGIMNRNAPLDENAGSRTKKPTKMRNRSQSLRDYYLALAAQHVSTIISPERVKEYVNRQKENNNKQKKIFNQYDTKCIQFDKKPNICEVMRMMNAVKPLYIPPDISNIPQVMLTQMIYKYSKLCVCMWYIIRTETQEGAKDPNKFRFNDFIPNILDLLKDGIEVAIREGEPKTTILEKDIFLNVLPELDREDTKNKSGISHRNMKSRRKKNSRMKEFIVEAIIKTLKKQFKHPSLLSPYTRDFESLDESKFVDLEVCTNKRKKTERGDLEKGGKMEEQEEENVKLEDQ